MGSYFLLHACFLNYQLNGKYTLKAINRIHLKTDLIFKSCHYLKAIFFWDRVYSISHYQLVTPKFRENIQNIFDQNLVNPV